MNKKKPWLLVYVIISFAVIISAVIVALTAGFNLGSDFAGGTQIEVLVTDNAKSENQLISDAKTVLRENGVSYEKILLEDKYTDTYLVIRTNNKSFNKDNVANNLAHKLEVEIEDVTGIYEISGFITKKAVIYISVATVLLILGIFFAGWIRYKLITAVSLTLAVLHSLIFSTSILILTRLPLNLVSFILLVTFSVFVLFAFVLTFERVLENGKLLHNKDLSGSELINLSSKQTAKTLIMVASAVMVVTIVLMFVPSLDIVFAALTMFVCLVTAAYSYGLIGLSLYGFMLTLKEAADKKRLSTDNSPAPKKR
ncbi:MAG: hypothetical protein IJS74_01800 [Clostridia bacterium]|nr:hypothetical protein [Clostridia bacterium]